MAKLRGTENTPRRTQGWAVRLQLVVSLYTDLPLVFASRCVVPTLAADLEISTQPKRSASTHAVTSQQFAARPVFVSTKETSLIQTLYEEAVLHLLLFYWEIFFYASF